MKKIISFAIIASALSISFVSCSKDDDSSSDSTPSTSNCQTCTHAALPTVTVCDNGDGTITVTSAGNDTEFPVEYATYIQTLTLAGASCN